MQEGKILKIRVGHEANCSSGMVPLIMLMFGGPTFLLLTIVASIVQAAKLKDDALTSERRKRYLTVPLVIGLIVAAGLTIFFLVASYGASDQAACLILGLSSIVSCSLAIAAGYKLVPRIRGFVCLVAPLIFVAGFAILAVLMGLLFL